jgi:ElaA protein
MTTGTWFLKTFNELSSDELYNILKLRNAIFIVDQQCVFADIDGRDQTYCYHFFCTLNGQIIAYARIFGPDQIYQEPCLSRVCTSLDQRGKGMGKELLKRTLDEMSRLFPGQSIRIGAQLYLKTFYENFGFKIDGDRYIEDGIEHIQMIKKELELSKQ